MSILRIYTDGGCSNNQGENNIGGWGAVLEFNGHFKELYGGEKNTTNNRMEITAVIEAFKALKKGGLEVEIFTDSSYVANCFREKWYEKWEKNGWMNSKKQPVENRELWEELLIPVRANSCRFLRVNGHINTKGAPSTMIPHYKKFRSMNKGEFSDSDILHFIEMNNRCDELANVAMDALRGSAETFLPAAEVEKGEDEK